MLRSNYEAIHVFMETFTEVFMKIPSPIDRLVQKLRTPKLVFG